MKINHSMKSYLKITLKDCKQTNHVVKGYLIITTKNENKLFCEALFNFKNEKSKKIIL